MKKKRAQIWIETKNISTRFLARPKHVNQKAQVWIETVLYTLIAFIMIGLVLSYAKPKIEELQDKAILDQSIIMMKVIDHTILGIGCAGNQRSIELGIKKGVLKIDGVNDKIIFEMESKSEYSEPGEDLNLPENINIIARTEKRGKFNLVTFTRDYGETCNLTFQGEDKLKSLSKSSTPFRLLISNKGKIENKTVIDMVV